MQDFEKLGVFYLGRPYDLKTKKPKEGLLLYDSKDLVTHAVCIGMTGSGKTGLCLESPRRGADRRHPRHRHRSQGDLPNLLLTFPELRAEDFAPGSTRTMPARRGSRSTPMPSSRRRCGRRGWRRGAGAARASSGCARRPTSPSTRRAAAPACRSPSSSRSLPRQAGHPRTPSCCGSGSAPRRPVCWACSASRPIRCAAASTS